MLESCFFLHIMWIWILLSMHYHFLMSEGLQETHIDALNPFRSKLITLTPRGGLWTFSAILALCAPPPIRAHARLVSIIYLSYFFRQITEGKVPWTGILVLARFFVNKTWYNLSSYLFVKPRREKFREGRFQTKSADFREQVWIRFLCVLTRFIQVYTVAGDVNLQSIWRKTHFVVTVIVIVFLIIIFLFFFVATFSEFVLKQAKKEVSL